MNIKIKYFVVTIISVFVMMIIITISPTRAKYIYSYNLESNLNIGYPVFDIKKDQSNNGFDFNNEVSDTLKVKNYNDENVVNAVEGKYYLKILDSNKNEISTQEAFIDGIAYVSYLKDSQGKLVDIDGNIVDEDGNILQERELTEEEKSLIVEIRKGFGPIILKSDGNVKEEKDLNLKINIQDKHASFFKYFVEVYIENTNDLSLTKFKEFEFTITNNNNQIDIYDEGNNEPSNMVDIYDDSLENQVNIYD